MNVLYIANLKTENKSGLLKATIERLTRMEKHVEKIFIINNNFYDSPILTLVKKSLRMKDILLEKPSEIQYRGLKINNSNYRRTIYFYLKRLLHSKKTEDGMIKHYLEKYSHELEQADVIHAQWGWTDGYIAYRLSQIIRKPFFITLHGSDINNIYEHNRTRLIEAMENAQKCFFVSGRLLEQAKKIGYSGKNAVVTYNGVDTDIYKPKNKKNKKGKRVGYIGSLKKIKGADLLPEIFENIYKRDPDVTFSIAGDGELKETLRTTFNKSKLNIDVLGPIDFKEVPSFFDSIDVLVVPSRNEGLGMVILEANAMGVPVVGTDAGGIPEAIGYQENIIPINEDLVHNMANRVIDVLNSQVNTSQLRQRVINKFDWENIVVSEVNEYKKTLNKQL